MELNWWKEFLFSLLPRSPLFSFVKDRFFTALVTALGSVPKEAHYYNGQNITDIFPETTTRADDWSRQFNFAKTLTASQLSARFKDSGGCSPNYLQNALHEAGLTSLYVHEWWVPGSDPVAARNPIPYINNYQPNNLLVNPITSIYDDIPQCGDYIQCGDPDQCGDSEGLKFEEKIYAHPDISDEYPYYFYVCGQTFGDYVTLSDDELSEAKRLIYKHKQAHLRCVLFVEASAIINTPTTGDEIIINTPTTGDSIIINSGV